MRAVSILTQACRRPSAVNVRTGQPEPSRTPGWVANLRVTMSHVPGPYEDLGWLPGDGAALTVEELVDCFAALRALLQAIPESEPARAHAVTVALVLARAVDRATGGGA